MKLTKVTFTGIDDLTHLGEIKSLSEEFPFVEWGLLLGISLKTKFPSIFTLEKYNTYLSDLNTSIHLCNRFAKNIAENKGFPLETALQLLPCVNRLQVNLGEEVSKYLFLTDELKRGCKYGLQMIVQVPNFQISTVKKFKDYSLNDQVVFLHDSSGGRGLESTFDTPVNNDFVGFAGGLNLQNIERKLDEIHDLKADNNFWIDIESGVRNRLKRFDTDMVCKILEKVKPYIG